MELEKMIYIQVESLKSAFNSTDPSIKNSIQNIMRFDIKKEDRLQLIVEFMIKNVSISDRITICNAPCRLERTEILNFLQDIHVHYAETTGQAAIDLLNAPEGDVDAVFNAVVDCIQEEIEIRAKIYTDVYNKNSRINSHFKFDTVQSFVYYLKNKKYMCMNVSHFAKILQQVQEWSGLSLEEMDNTCIATKDEIISIIRSLNTHTILEKLENIMDNYPFTSNDSVSNQIFFFVLSINKHWEEIKKVEFMWPSEHYDRMLSLFQKAYDWRLSLEEQTRCREEIDKKAYEDKEYLQKVILEETQQAPFEKGAVLKKAEEAFALFEDLSAYTNIETKHDRSKSFLVFFSMLKSFMCLSFGIYHSFLSMAGASFSETLRLKIDMFLLLNIVLCIQSTGEGLSKKENKKEESLGTIDLIINYASDFAYFIAFFVGISVIICTGFSVFVQQYCIYSFASVILICNVFFSLSEISKTVREFLSCPKNRLLPGAMLVCQFISLFFIVYVHVTLYQSVTFENNKLLNVLFKL